MDSGTDLVAQQVKPPPVVLATGLPVQVPDVLLLILLPAKASESSMRWSMLPVWKAKLGF